MNQPLKQSAVMSRRQVMIGAAGLSFAFVLPGGAVAAVLAPARDGKAVTTIEGLSPDGSHPLQKAWIAEQVPQCGYCQSGQIMQAAELLAKTRRPTREQIVAHMDGNICRCGTYPRIVRAIERAAREG